MFGVSWLQRFVSAAIIFLAASFLSAAVLVAQVSSSATSQAAAATTEPAVNQLLAHHPWEFGPFFNGGVGTSDRSDYSFLSTGIHVGRVLGSPFGPGILHGQFEFAGDLMPWWQGRTPKFDRANCFTLDGQIACSALYPTGGNFNGVSITPIILRWNLLSQRDSHRRLLPFVQGAGGLIWTNHKYPPVGPYQLPNKQGASVFNFTPQFGVGVQYFIRPKQSITFQANAVHISSASLGDTNPGVNASVQFALGYTWWK